MGHWKDAIIIANSARLFNDHSRLLDARLQPAIFDS